MSSDLLPPMYNILMQNNQGDSRSLLPKAINIKPYFTETLVIFFHTNLILLHFTLKCELR